ncbi:hypothetical protein ACFC6L_16490 [Kitasatospora phosalacinea]|uniref:hypothetical protein n=1 Tax=Kitasatospora phosalacinea TaxID=2065 RepID=UPI0035D6964B
MSTPVTPDAPAFDVAIRLHPQRPGVHAALGRMPQPVAEAVLPSLGFEPDPDEPRLFTFTGPEHYGQQRARAAVQALRTMGHRVEVEPAFDVPGSAWRPSPDEPDVAFGRHPDLGIVAAVSDGLPIDPAPFLTRAGWHHVPALDIYLAPTRRHEAGIDAVAALTEPLRQGRYTVAVDYALAAAIRPPGTGTGTREHARASTSPGAPVRTAPLPPAAPSGVRSR